jgi:hypothetical protein
MSPPERIEGGVTDPGIDDGQLLEGLEACQVCQSGIPYARVTHAEALEGLEAGQVSQSGIRDARVTQVEQWLYEEVDLMNDHRGPFVHRILFSTGISLEIPFVSVIIHQFTVPAVTKRARQMA